jgi:cytochrome o ubiquinol oxidase subunit 2
MSTKFKIIFGVLVVVELLLLASFFLGSPNIQVLNPQGPIARQERDLIIAATLIMLTIIGPVYFSIFFMARRYREGNRSIDRSHKIKNNKLIEVSWWIWPMIIVATIAAITWKATHHLDPYKPINSNVEPVKIQVVALRWKWLFIYPHQNIATINFVQFPKDTPVNFELTSDAPMNSFWIPSLSGQIYAMTGMSTKLHLVADKEGDYPGSAAEINGVGFSGMKFTARSSTKDQFDEWVAGVKRDGKALSAKSYEKLSLPSINESVAHYSSVERGLYNKIIMKYMFDPGSKMHHHE